MKKIFFITFLALVVFAGHLHAQTYILARTFLNPSTDIDDEFGLTTALFGNNLLVGALEDDTFGPNQGIVYLFETSTGNIFRTFRDPTPNPNDGEVGFGVSIAVNGSHVLVGAHRDDAVDGDDGAVYLLDGSDGSLLRTFNNPASGGVGGGDLFGSSAVFVGNNVLVSSPGEDAEGTNAGRVYLFNGTTGLLMHTFINPTPAIHSGFGNRIAVAGGVIVIRARFDVGAAVDAGAVYVYNSSSPFTPIQTILNPSSDPEDDFGSFIATDGNNVLVGASGNDIDGMNSGIAYLFNSTTGALIHTFLNPTPAANDLFGLHGGIFGNKILIGSPRDDTGATDAGAAYLFDSVTGDLITTFLNPAPAFEDLFGRSFAVLNNDIFIGAPGQTQPNAGKVYLFAEQPVADAGADQEICFGQSVAIGGNPTATGGTPPYVYSWTPSIGLDDVSSATPNASPNSTIEYTVQVTDANGSIATDQVIVTVNSLLAITFNPVAPLCLNAAAVDLINFVSPTGGTFSGPGITGNTFTPSVAGVGTHTITYSFVDPNNCSNNATQNIVVNALPVVAFNSVGPFCVNVAAVDLANFVSPTGGTFSGPGITGDNFTPSAAGVGTHTITYTIDANNCSNSATQNIVVNALPAVTFNLVGPFCESVAAVDLSNFVSPTGGTFSGPGITGNSFTPSVAGVGTHTITYTFADANNCSNTAAQNIIVNSQASVTFNPVGPFCENAAPVDLTNFVSPAGGTFSGPGITGTTFAPSAAGVGMHTITYTFADANNCGNTASQNITVHPQLIVTFNPVGPFCANTPAVDLSSTVSPAGGAFSGPGIAGSVFNPSTAGIGTHVITYAVANANCGNSASQSIVVNPALTGNAGPDLAICVGQSVTIGGSPTATGGMPPYTFSWTPITGLDDATAANPTASPASTTIYTVNIVDANGCTASDQTTIIAQTPQSAIQGLIDQVDALVAAGKLNQGQGNALKAKLNAAIQQLNRGKTNTAINQLQAFINQVNAFIIAGILSPADGQALIDAANNIINCISGLSKARVTEQSPTIALPQGYALEQNYPNPFNPETEIRFQLPEATHVVAKIFNTLGEEIRTLVDGQYEAGYHSLSWNGKDKNGNQLSSGVYLYQLRAKTFSQIRKMVLLQ